MTRQTSFVHDVARAAACIPMAVVFAAAAAGQVWSEAEATTAAAEIALACGDGLRDRLVPDDLDFRLPSHPLAYPIGRGTWTVFFGQTIVSVSDGAAVKYSWSGPQAASLEGNVEPPFVPFCPSPAEWVERARAVCRTLGASNITEFVEIESRVPVAGQDGKVRTRTLSITLNESGPGFPTLTGGNYIRLGLDAKTGEPYSVTYQSGYQYEPVPGQTVGKAEALATLRAAVDLGEVVEARGPVYTELLGAGEFTPEGRSFKERAVLPLAYSITGEKYHGTVSAVSGKILRTRSRSATGSTGNRRGGTAERAAVPTTKATGAPEKQVFALGLLCIAAIGGLAWFFLRGRASRLGQTQTLMTDKPAPPAAVRGQANKED